MDLRTRAEQDLDFFIRLVAPERVLGSCHTEVIEWWERHDARPHQLLLLPRDHMKSALIAYRVAWWLTKDPTLRILYISSTANLAEKQLGFIKTIVDSERYRTYWPEHIHPEEGRRERWTSTEITLDHPLRKKENIRDPSIFTGGLTTNLVGMHCDIAVLDDVVTSDNAYTKEGREKVRKQYSLLSSIEAATAKEWVVGTRYHPNDLYNDMIEMQESSFEEDGSLILGSEKPVFEIHSKTVESHGDGTGEFLWPRQQRKDGKWFGFNAQILATKKAKYLDKTQFYAQYYNDPHDPDSAPNVQFNYFDKQQITSSGGQWFYRGKKLNITAAVDFAYTTGIKSDYSAIVLVGRDSDNVFYVLDIDRFKTNDITGYFSRIFRMYNHWGFRRLVCEGTAAQTAIVKALKELFQEHRLSCQVIEVKPTRHEGTKKERITAVLNPRYEAGQVLHYRGGNTQVLEEELISWNPKHDDVKDALANAIDNSIRPGTVSNQSTRSNVVKFNKRFGGRFRA